MADILCQFIFTSSVLEVFKIKETENVQSLISYYEIIL